MAQRVTGLYRLITLPTFYKGLMSLLGSDRAIKRYATEMLRAEPGIKMLDVGCGPANVLAYLPDLNYTGIDFNQQHIRFASERYGLRGRFIVGHAAEELRQEAASFDLINVSALMHHLDDDECEKLFVSLKPLLKPTGRIVTIDNVWLPNQRLTVRLINKMDSGLNIRTPDGYARLLENQGFRVERTIYNDLLRIPYDHFCMTAHVVSTQMKRPSLAKCARTD